MDFDDIEDKYINIDTILEHSTYYDNMDKIVAADIYAIFYNEDELNAKLDILKETKISYGIGKPNKFYAYEYKSFPAVQDIRKIIGYNSYVIKEGSSIAKPTINYNSLINLLNHTRIITKESSSFFNLVVEYINNYSRYTYTNDDVVSALNYCMETNKKIDVDTNDIFEFIIDDDRVIDIEKNRKILELYAKKINLECNSNLNSAFIVYISRMGGVKNELLLDIKLNVDVFETYISDVIVLKKILDDFSKVDFNKCEKYLTDIFNIELDKIDMNTNYGFINFTEYYTKNIKKYNNFHMLLIESIYLLIEWLDIINS